MQAQVSVGSGFGCAVLDEGVARCFGRVAEDPTLNPAGRGPYTKVAVGLTFTCGILEDGDIDCFGDPESPAVARQPYLSEPLLDIAAGRNHACGITQTGRLLCWGAHPSTFWNDLNPSQRFRKVLISDEWTCALEEEGRISCWQSPTTVSAFSLTYRDFCIGVNHGCGVLWDGSIRCIGTSSNFGSATANVTTEVQPVAIGCSSSQTCVVRNDTFQLACYSSGGLSFPLGSDPVRSVSLRGSSVCAIGQDGLLYGTACANSATPSSQWMDLKMDSRRWCGVVLNGTIVCQSRSSFPDMAMVPWPRTLQVAGASVVSVSSGRSHACVVGETGTASCVGLNRDFGIASGGPSVGERIVTVSAGWNHTCVLRSVGKSGCWGRHDAFPFPSGPNGAVVRDVNGNKGTCQQYSSSCQTFDSRIHPWPKFESFRSLVAGFDISCGVLLDEPGAISCFGVGRTPNMAEVIDRTSSPVVSLGVGAGFFCVSLSSGSAKCMSIDGSATLATVTSTLSHVNAVVVGHSIACFLLVNSDLRCFARPSGSPITVPPFRFLSASASISVCGVTVDGELVCFGPGSEKLVSPFAPPDQWLSSGSGSRLISGPALDAACVLRLSSPHADLRCWGSSPRSLSVGPTTSPTSRKWESTFSWNDGALGATCGCIRTAGALQWTCWGFPSDCCFGDTANCPSSPGNRLENLSIGWAHGCGIALGRPQCWGSWQETQMSGLLSTRNTTMSVAAGRTHSCAVFNDPPFLECWGDALIVNATPNAVGNESSIPIDVCAGDGFSCTLLANESESVVHCWTREESTADLFTERVSELHCGWSHWCVLLEDGSAQCRGWSVLVPQIPQEVRLSSLATGKGHVCGTVLPEGIVRCWGDQDMGRVSKFAQTNLASSSARDQTTIRVGPSVNVTANTTADCQGLRLCTSLADAVRFHNKRARIIQILPGLEAATPAAFPETMFLSRIEGSGIGPHLTVGTRSFLSTAISIVARPFEIHSLDVELRVEAAVLAVFSVQSNTVTEIAGVRVRGTLLSTKVVVATSPSHLSLSVDLECNVSTSTTSSSLRLFDLTGAQSTVSVRDSRFRLTRSSLVTPKSTRVCTDVSFTFGTMDTLQVENVSLSGDGWWQYVRSLSDSCVANSTAERLDTEFSSACAFKPILDGVGSVTSASLGNIHIHDVEVGDTPLFITDYHRCSERSRLQQISTPPALIRFTNAGSLTIESLTGSNVAGPRWIDLEGTNTHFTLRNVDVTNWTAAIVAPLNTSAASFPITNPLWSRFAGFPSAIPGPITSSEGRFALGTGLFVRVSTGTRTSLTVSGIRIRRPVVLLAGSRSGVVVPSSTVPTSHLDVALFRIGGPSLSVSFSDVSPSEVTLLKDSFVNASTRWPVYVEDSASSMSLNSFIHFSRSFSALQEPSYRDIDNGAALLLWKAGVAVGELKPQRMSGIHIESAFSACTLQGSACLTAVVPFAMMTLSVDRISFAEPTAPPPDSSFESSPLSVEFLGAFRGTIGSLESRNSHRLGPGAGLRVLSYASDVSVHRLDVDSAFANGAPGGAVSVDSLAADPFSQLNISNAVLRNLTSSFWGCALTTFSVPRIAILNMTVDSCDSAQGVLPQWSPPIRVLRSTPIVSHSATPNDDISRLSDGGLAEVLQHVANPAGDCTPFTTNGAFRVDLSRDQFPVAGIILVLRPASTATWRHGATWSGQYRIFVTDSVQTPSTPNTVANLVAGSQKTSVFIPCSNCFGRRIYVARGDVLSFCEIIVLEATSPSLSSSAAGTRGSVVSIRVDNVTLDAEVSQLSITNSSVQQRHGVVSAAAGSALVLSGNDWLVPGVSNSAETVHGSGGLLHVSSGGPALVNLTSFVGIGVNVTGNGGILSIQGSSATLALTNSSLRSGEAVSGGLVSVNAQLDAHVELRGSHFGDGNGVQPGGMAAVMGQNVNVTVEDVVMSGGSSRDGGLLFLNAALLATVSLKESTLRNGAAKGSGGLVHLRGATVKFTTMDTSFINGSAGTGGCIALESFSSNPTDSVQVHLSSSTLIQNCFAADDAGGVLVSSVRAPMNVTIDRARLSNLTATKSGGGIAMSTEHGSLAFLCSASVIERSNARLGSGGAIYGKILRQDFEPFATLVLDNGCQVLHSQARLDGGAIFLLTTAWTRVNVTRGSKIEDSTSLTGSGGAFAQLFFANTTVTYPVVFHFHGATFRRNRAPLGRGGAIRIELATTQVENSMFEDHEAREGGTIYASSSSTIMKDTILRRSTALGGNGGCLFIRSAVLKGILFEKNVTLDECTALGSESQVGQGGGLFAEASPFVGTMLSVTNCNAGEGGAVFFLGVSEGMTLFAPLIVRNNSASVNSSALLPMSPGIPPPTARGGGFVIRSSRFVSIEGCSLVDPSFPCVFSNNVAAGVEGGSIVLENIDRRVILSSIQVLSSSARGRGGGIAVLDSMVNVTDSHFDGCTVEETGGAIFVASEESTDFDVKGTLFSNNVAGIAGGGVFWSCATCAAPGPGLTFVNNSVGLYGPDLASVTARGRVDPESLARAPLVLPGQITQSTVMTILLVDAFDQIDTSNDDTVCSIVVAPAASPFDRFPLMTSGSYTADRGRVHVSPFGLVSPLNISVTVTMACPNEDGSFTYGAANITVSPLIATWVTTQGSALPSRLGQLGGLTQIVPFPRLRIENQLGELVVNSSVDCTLVLVDSSEGPSTNSFLTGTVSKKTTTGFIEFDSLGVYANLGSSVLIQAQCRWVTGASFSSLDTFRVDVPLLTARWTNESFVETIVGRPWFNKPLPTILVSVVDEDGDLAESFNDADGDCALSLFTTVGTRRVTIPLLGQTIDAMRPTGIMEFLGVTIRPDETLVQLPMTLRSQCTFRGRLLDPLDTPVQLELHSLRWFGVKPVEDIGRLLFNTEVRPFAVQMVNSRAPELAISIDDGETECSVEVLVVDAATHRVTPRVFLSGFTSGQANASGVANFREITLRPDREQVLHQMEWVVTCVFRGLRAPLLRSPTLVESFSLQWLTRPPARTLPSPRTRPVPFSDVVEIALIARSTGEQYDVELDTVCSLTADDFTFSDRTPESRKIVSLLNAVTAVVQRSTVRFPGLAVSGPFGATLVITVTCNRRQGDFIPSTSSSVAINALVLDWSPDPFLQPPPFVLFRNRYLVSADARLDLGDGNVELIRQGFAEIIACRLRVSEGDLQLSFVDVEATRRIDPSTSSVTLELRLEGGALRSSKIQLVCTLGDEESSTKDVLVTMHRLWAVFFHPPPTETLPSSISLRKVISPAPVLGVFDTFGSPVSIESLRCHVRIRLQSDEISAAAGSITILNPPLDGYGPESVTVGTARSQTRSELEFGWLNGTQKPSWAMPESGGGNRMVRLSMEPAADSSEIIVTRVISFDRIIVVSPFNTSLILSFECAREEGDKVPPLLWKLRVPDVRAFLSVPPPPSAAAQQAMRAVVELHSQDGGVSVSNASLAVEDDETQCTAQLQSNNSLYGVNGGRGNAERGVVTFSGVSVLARMGDVVNLSFQCRRGDYLVAEGDEMRSTLRMEPCPPGLEPSGAVGERCTNCPKDTYSEGKNGEPCEQCPPRGVGCEGGILRLLPNYFLVLESVRVVNETTGAVYIDENAEFHECFNEEACIVDSDGRRFKCREGYTGPLCGVCDPAVEYARQGPKCIPCWSTAANIAILAIGGTLFLAVMTHFVVRRKFDSQEQAPIAFRIGLNYVQALGALGIYKARGTETFRLVFGFAETVGASFFAASPLQCLFRPSFFARYYTSLVAPLLAAVIAILVNTVATLANGDGCRGLRDFFVHHRYLNAVILVLHLSYAVLASQSFVVLDCLSETIGGRTFLKADLGVECFTNEHTVSMVIASFSLVLFGFGLPAFFAFILRRNESQLRSPDFHAKLGFLYRGYNIKDKLYWWESVSLMRKAGIVIIGSFFQDPYYAIIGALLLTVVSLALHLHFKPYERSEFNFFETLALSALTLTQVVSLLFLRSSRLEVSVSDRERSDTITSVVLLFINIVTSIALVRFIAKEFATDMSRKQGESWTWVGYARSTAHRWWNCLCCKRASKQLLGLSTPPVRSALLGLVQNPAFSSRGRNQLAGVQAQSPTPSTSAESGSPKSLESRKRPIVFVRGHPITLDESQSGEIRSSAAPARPRAALPSMKERIARAQRPAPSSSEQTSAVRM